MIIISSIICLVLLTRWVFVLTKYLKTGVFKKKVGGKKFPQKMAGYSFGIFAIIFFLIFLGIITDFRGINNAVPLTFFIIAAVLGITSGVFYELNYLGEQSFDKGKSVKLIDQIRSQYDNEDHKYCLDIARIISNNDSAVVSVMEELSADPVKYYIHHTVGQPYQDNPDILNGYVWETMFNCLSDSKYAFWSDWKGDIDDFIYCMNNMLKSDIEFSKDSLNENGDISEWIKALDHQAQTKNMRVGYIDFDSDAYAVFVCGKDQAEELSKLSRRIKF